MRTLPTIITLIIISSKLFGTNQVKDILIYNNDTLDFYESPLELAPGISERNLGRELIGDDFISFSSGCWRGFKAEWIIKDSVLYLKNVYECSTNNNINGIIEKLTGLRFKSGLLKADWVNSNFWCGKDLVGGLFMSIYEHEYFFYFNAGVIKETQIYHYKPCKIGTEEELINYIFNQINWDNAPSIIDKQYRISVYLEPNEAGGVGDVIFQSRYNEFVPLLWKILWNLPCLNVYYLKNEFYDIGESIKITIDRENKAKYVR